MKTHVCGHEGCGKAFSFRFELCKHMREDHKPICQLCKKVFKNNDSLRKHVSTMHTNKRDYYCPYDGCNRVYQTVTLR